MVAGFFVFIHKRCTKKTSKDVEKYYFTLILFLIMSNAVHKPRCQNCKKVLVNGTITGGITQIKCGVCGFTNAITVNVLTLIKSMSKVD